MSRARHARRTPTKALLAVGAAILAGMAFVMPDVLATEGTDHESGGRHTLAVTKLPELKGSPTYVEAINDHGVAVGHADFGKGSRQAVIWEDGKVRELEDLGGGSMAFDINTRGEVVGSAFTGKDDKVHAVLWEANGQIRDLGTVEGSKHSAATAINDARQIVGTLSDNLNDSSPQAFLWENGEMRKLDIPGKSAAATDIAGTGDIVGAVTGADDVERPFLLRDGEVRTIRERGLANTVNDAGNVAGGLEWDFNAPRLTPTFLPDGNVRFADDLRATDGTDGQVTSMNEKDDLVGVLAFEDDRTQAVLWEKVGPDGHGFTLLSPVEGHHSAEATDINNNGVIVGNSAGGHGTDPVIWK